MRFSNLMMAAALILLGSILSPYSATGNEILHGLGAGQYSGASQLMIVAEDGVVTYDDSPLGICQVEIMRNGTLKAGFPDKDLGRGKWHTVTLNLSTNEPRTVWTTVIKDDTYKVTAIPFSPNAYVFRLEIRNNDKLVAGAQQFYAIEPK